MSLSGAITPVAWCHPWTFTHVAWCHSGSSFMWPSAILGPSLMWTDVTLRPSLMWPDATLGRHHTCGLMSFLGLTHVTWCHSWHHMLFSNVLLLFFGQNFLVNLFTFISVVWMEHEEPGNAWPTFFQVFKETMPWNWTNEGVFTETTILADYRVTNYFFVLFFSSSHFSFQNGSSFWWCLIHIDCHSNRAWLDAEGLPKWNSRESLPMSCTEVGPGWSARDDHQWEGGTVGKKEDMVHLVELGSGEWLPSRPEDVLGWVTTRTRNEGTSKGHEWPASVSKYLSIIPSLLRSTNWSNLRGY